MKTIDKWVNRFVIICINVSLGVIALLVILQVTFRFILNSPLPWPEELSRLFFIYLVFIGGAFSSRSDTHIAIDLIDSMLPSARVLVVLRIARNLLTTIVLGVAVYGSYTIIPKIRLMSLPATGLPMSLMVIPILLGCALMIFWTVMHIARDVSAFIRDTADIERA
jgi:TRAP-type C4-dicarboxylate transport system permease small subunit